MPSLSQRRAGARNGARLAERAISEEKERQAQEAASRQVELVAQRKAARQAESDRPRLTAEDVKGARIVRDSCGWHEVVRVSAKSVTVKTAYSWTDRIPLDRILQVAK